MGDGTFVKSFLGLPSLEAFFENYWATDAFLSWSVEPSSCGLGIDQIVRLIDGFDIRYPNVSLSGPIGDIDPKLYTHSTSDVFDPRVNVSRIQPLLDAGYTGRVKQISRYAQELFKVNRVIENFFNCPVSMNAYFGGRASVGTAGHYDDHHVFALQLQGSKTWRLGEQLPITTRYARGKRDNSPTRNAVQKITSTPGQVLYLPPGRWHQADASSDSLHITIGVHPPSISSQIKSALNFIFSEKLNYKNELEVVFSNDKLHYRNIEEDLIKNLGQEILERIAHIDRQWLSHETQCSANAGMAASLEVEASGGGGAINLRQVTHFLLHYVPFTSSIYIRGSAAKNDHNKKPWDIDIFVVTNDIIDTKKIAEDFREEFPDYPMLDLSAFSISEIQDKYEFCIKKLLLIEEGQLIFGSPLKNDIKPIEAADFELIWRRSLEISEKKMRECDDVFVTPDGDQLSPIEFKRAAKAALRLIGAAVAAQRQSLERSPLNCAEIASSMSADVRPNFALKELKRVVLGGAIEIDILNDSVRAVTEYATKLREGIAE